jgi:hypothetical protein
VDEVWATHQGQRPGLGLEPGQGCSRRPRRRPRPLTKVMPPPAACPCAPRLPGVAGHAHRKWGDDFTSGATVVRVLSLLMLILSILIAVWAGYNFNNRANMLTCAGGRGGGVERGEGRLCAPGTRWRAEARYLHLAPPTAPAPSSLVPFPPTLCARPRRLKADGPYDSRLLPGTLAVCLVSALMVVFSGAVVRLHSST